MPSIPAVSIPTPNRIICVKGKTHLCNLSFNDFLWDREYTDPMIMISSMF